MSQLSCIILTILAIITQPILPQTEQQTIEEETYKETSWDRVAIRDFRRLDSVDSVFIATIFIDGFALTDEDRDKNNVLIDATLQLEKSPRVIMIIREVEDFPSLPPITIITLEPTQIADIAEWRLTLQSSGFLQTQRPLDFLLEFHPIWNLRKKSFFQSLITFATTLRALPDATLPFSYINALGIVFGTDFPYDGSLTKKTKGSLFSLMVTASHKQQKNVGALILTIEESTRDIILRAESNNAPLSLNEALEQIDSLIDPLPGMSMPNHSVKHAFFNSWEGTGYWERIDSIGDLRITLRKKIAS